jgi:hypothetical protein
MGLLGRYARARRDLFLARAAAAALRRGVRGSRGWLVVGVSLGAVGVLRRVLAEPGAHAAIELHTGDALEVRVVEPAAR